jgi:1-acyl-sn-glycerol-3-phosphate acyltransferase
LLRVFQGNHILIDREDRRSQLRTFKEGIGWLKKGVPIMAFPEGMRSRDGRLMEFKGGLFSMAVKTKVPIVPISISHAHAVMPGNSLFPVQRGAGKLHVHIHDPIDTSDKKEAELGELVRVSFLSQLPFDQHPLALEADQDIIVESKRVEKHSVQVTSIADVSLQPTVATKESSEHSNIESAKATP